MLSSDWLGVGCAALLQGQFSLLISQQNHTPWKLYKQSKLCSLKDTTQMGDPVGGASTPPHCTWTTQKCTEKHQNPTMNRPCLTCPNKKSTLESMVSPMVAAHHPCLGPLHGQRRSYEPCRWCLRWRERSARRNATVHLSSQSELLAAPQKGSHLETPIQTHWQVLKLYKLWSKSLINSPKISQ